MNNLFHRQFRKDQIRQSNGTETANSISDEVFDPILISDDVFALSTEDRGLLSVYRSELFSQEQSHIHYTTTNPNKEKYIGVASVSREHTNNLGIESINDDENSFPGHSLLDFRPFEALERNKRREIRKQLRMFAENNRLIWVKKQETPA